jgi:hypothetical protein
MRFRSTSETPCGHSKKRFVLIVPTRAGIVKIVFIGLLLAGVAQAASAQQLPSAGGQLRQLPPAPPVAQPVLPDLRVERTSASAAADPAAGPAFAVAALHITGMTVFP